MIVTMGKKSEFNSPPDKLMTEEKLFELIRKYGYVPVSTIDRYHGFKPDCIVSDTVKGGSRPFCTFASRSALESKEMWIEAFLFQIYKSTDLIAEMFDTSQTYIIRMPFYSARVFSD